MTYPRRGFTLIELLIVVVIIGILASIAIPKFNNTKQKAYIATMKSDLRNLVTAEEAFFADSQRYADMLDTSFFGRRRRRMISVSGSGLLFDASTGVSDPAIIVGPGYWTATVAHMQMANFSCGIGVNTVNPINPGIPEGSPFCQ